MLGLPLSRQRQAVQTGLTERMNPIASVLMIVHSLTNLQNAGKGTTVRDGICQVK